MQPGCVLGISHQTFGSTRSDTQVEHSCQCTSQHVYLCTSTATPAPLPLPLHLYRYLYPCTSTATSTPAPLPLYLYLCASTSASLPLHLYLRISTATSTSLPLPLYLYLRISTAPSAPLPVPLHRYLCTSTSVLTCCTTVLEMFRQHNRQRIELHAFATHPGGGDAHTALLTKAVPTWHSVSVQHLCSLLLSGVLTARGETDRRVSAVVGVSEIACVD